MNNIPQYKVNWWDKNEPGLAGKTFNYHRYHYPSQTEENDSVRCLNENIFYQLLNKWNGQNPHWKYWA